MQQARLSDYQDGPTAVVNRMALDVKKRDFIRQQLADQKAEREQAELKQIEDERQRLFKERRLREAQNKAEPKTEPDTKASNPLKVRSLRKFMKD